MSIVNNKIIGGDMTVATASSVQKLMDRIRELRAADSSVVLSGAGSKGNINIEIGELWISGTSKKEDKSK